MFCYKCGTQLPDDARFCVKCGTMVQVPVGGAQPQASAPQPQYTAAPAYSAPAPEAPAASRGTVPPPINKSVINVECELYEDLNSDQHITGNVSIVDQKTLRIVSATYIVVAIQTKQKTFELANLRHVTITAEGTGFLGRKYEAVFYPKNARPFKLIGSGQSFQILAQNAAAYGNATFERI